MAVIIDRLTPFENFLFSSDRPHQPMVIYGRLLLDGPLDTERLERTLSLAVARHPLLNARVVHRGIIPCWETLPRSPLHFKPTTLRDLFNQPPIDIRKERGIRVWTIPAAEGEQTEIWLEIHHCCADGLAILQLIKEWRDIDAGTPEEVKEAQIDQQEFVKAELRRLRLRGEHKIGWISKRQIQRILRFYRTRNVVQLRDQEQRTQYNRKGFIERIPDVVEHLKERPPVDGIRWTLNDVLVCASYLAMFRLAAAEDVEPGKMYRLGVPVSTRDRTRDRELVANCVSMTFLDRPSIAEPTDENRKELLKSVAGETGILREHRLHMSMLHTLRAIYPWHWLPKSITGSSMILSNIGRVGVEMNNDFSWGENRLASAVLFPPLREGVNLAVGVLGNGPELHLGVIYNNDFLSDEYTSRFVELLREEIHRLIAILKPANGAQSTEVEQ